MVRIRTGQSVEIGKGLLTVFGLGVFYLLLNEVAVPLESQAGDTITNSTAQQANDWLFIGWEWYLLFSLGVVVTGVIAAAAYQRQGGL